MPIIPIAFRENNEGELEAVLSHEDFEKVRQGYGCSNCLQDYNGVWQAACHICGVENFQSFDLHPNDTSFVMNEKLRKWMPGAA